MNERRSYNNSWITKSRHSEMLFCPTAIHHDFFLRCRIEFPDCLLPMTNINSKCDGTDSCDWRLNSQSHFRKSHKKCLQYIGETERERERDSDKNRSNC
ncbi:hypothetical protein CEXT_205791 [Caerostris extrusa]|uniref:Uncharacterized protein n=1 Tax=Caerostris extrusa TaxID=172846 RepID=A0AAV4WND1_CAEEX|nr:hypothetical protein CEXT_205791 [Caerostris extrusa]